jgi:hypothetical protein
MAKHRPAVGALGLLLAALILPSPSSAQSQSRQLGLQLHEAVLSTYGKLRADRQLNPRPEGNDLTALVSSYIRPGMSLREAVDVLRSAGFSTTGEPAPPVAGGLRRPDVGWVYASFDVNPRSFLRVVRTTVHVRLLPGVDQRQQKTVAQVSASLSSVSL